MKAKEIYGEGLTGYQIDLDVFDGQDIKTQVDICVKLVKENSDVKGRIRKNNETIVKELTKLLYFCDHMTSHILPRETNDLFVNPRDGEEECAESIINNDYAQSHLEKSHEDIFLEH